MPPLWGATTSRQVTAASDALPSTSARQPSPIAVHTKHAAPISPQADFWRQVQVGDPLPFNIRDSGRMLLLATGQIIASDAQLPALRDRSALTDDSIAAPAVVESGDTRTTPGPVGRIDVRCRRRVARVRAPRDASSPGYQLVDTFLEHDLHVRIALETFNLPASA